MVRFSSKVKEIFDLILYHSDINKAQNLMSELTEPLDQAFARYWSALNMLLFQKLDKLLLVLKQIKLQNQQLGDSFLEILVNYLYALYYMGWNNPSVTPEESKKYLDLIEEKYPKLQLDDEWEKY